MVKYLQSSPIILQQDLLHCCVKMMEIQISKLLQFRPFPDIRKLEFVIKILTTLVMQQEIALFRSYMYLSSMGGRWDHWK